MLFFPVETVTTVWSRRLARITFFGGKSKYLTYIGYLIGKQIKVKESREGGRSKDKRMIAIGVDILGM